MGRNFPIVIHYSQIGGARGCLSGTRLVFLMGFLIVLTFIYGIQISKIAGGVGVAVFLVLMGVGLLGYRGVIFAPLTNELRGYRTKQIEIWGDRIAQLGDNFTEIIYFKDIEKIHLSYPDKLSIRSNSKKTIVLKGNMWPVNDILEILCDLAAPSLSRDFLDKIENGKNITFTSHLSVANSILFGGFALCILGITSFFNEVFGIPKGVFLTLSILTGGLISGITLIIGYFATRGSELILNKNCIKRPFEGFGVELCWQDVKKLVLKKDFLSIDGHSKSYRQSRYAPNFLVFLNLVKNLAPSAAFTDELRTKQKKDWVEGLESPF